VGFELFHGDGRTDGRTDRERERDMPKLKSLFENLRTCLKAVPIKFVVEVRYLATDQVIRLCLG